MIGNIASIATLILFIIYFIGRIMSLIIEKKMVFERVDTYFREEDIPHNLKIVDEYRCECADEILIITPHEKSYKWLAIYECKFNEKTNKLEKGKELERFKNILNDTSVRIDTIISCGIPSYMIEFERTDFTRGILALYCNNKNGVQEELIESHHTWKSVIYYLFR